MSERRYGSPIAPNIYDDDAFFAEYARLRRSVDGLAGVPSGPRCGRWSLRSSTVASSISGVASVGLSVGGGHYVGDLGRLVGVVHRCLAPGGRLVFSVEHPVFTATASPGFVEGPDGAVTRPVDSYLVEGERTTNWLLLVSARAERA